jgi:hypothetical protein
MTQPQPQQSPPSAAPVPRTNGLAVAGMVCGIIGLVLFWTFWLGIILGILGVIFGAIGMSRARAWAMTGRGMGLAGVICGGLAILLSIVWVGLIVAVFVDSGVDVPVSVPNIEQP